MRTCTGPCACTNIYVYKIFQRILPANKTKKHTPDPRSPRQYMKHAKLQSFIIPSQAVNNLSSSIWKIWILQKVYLSLANSVSISFQN